MKKGVYKSTRLTFKRDIIELLDDDDLYVNETREGVFTITKKEFYKVFDNVVNSRSYKDGNYNYKTTPQKAYQFFTRKKLSSAVTENYKEQITYRQSPNYDLVGQKINDKVKERERMNEDTNVIENKFYQKIINLIKQPIPIGLSIAKSTTPIPFFGDYANAKACTISINPSYCEFYDNNGYLLENTTARLVSRKNLNKTDSEELSDEDAKLVLEKCTKYFSNNPYKNYFDKLEKFLNTFNSKLSYYSGSVVALDLFPWATNPVWGKIPENKQKVLASKGKTFLENLLKEKKNDFKYIFINGRTAFNTIKEYLSIDYSSKKVPISDSSCDVFFGKIYGIDFIGWSSFISNWHIRGNLYENIKKLAEKISVEYNSWKNT